MSEHIGTLRRYISSLLKVAFSLSYKTWRQITPTKEVTELRKGWNWLPTTSLQVKKLLRSFKSVPYSVSHTTITLSFAFLVTMVMASVAVIMTRGAFTVPVAVVRTFCINKKRSML